ncbi:MAG: hypothetical protein ACE5GV_16455, partial [Candidatus Scalindua sp.]
MYSISQKGQLVLKSIFHLLLNCTLIIKPPDGVETEVISERCYSDSRKSGEQRADERIDIALPIALP